MPRSRVARRATHPVAALALLALVASQAELRADAEPRIPGVSSWLTGRELHVEARLSPGLPDEVQQRLTSGLPTTTVWEIRLFVFRNLWFDGLKDSRRYEVTATYRPVTGDYTVERRLDGRLLDTRLVPSRVEAQRALEEVPGLPVFTMGPHLDGKKLLVRVRCVYGSGVALAVVPTTRETDWVRSGIFAWREARK